jgi:type IV pilus assembly protein PilC
MKFNYQARTEKGEVRSGTIEASSREGALDLLQKYGLYVTVLEETRAVPIYAKKIKIFERISTKEIVLFTRQLSIMVASKSPLVESLRILISQTQSLSFKEKILKISEDVEGGISLSRALAKHPKVFSSFFISMVRSGEAAGKLSQSLNYLAEHLEKEYRLMNKIRGAMIYPAFIIFVAIAVLILMIFLVIPNLIKVLEETGQELPILTRAIISFTNFARSWGWLFLLATIALAISAFRYRRTKQGKKAFDRIFLRLPIIGSFLKMVYLSRFAENLSTLISGGLPIAKALEITGDIVGNTVYKEIILQARDEVRRGEAISSVLNRFPKVFPPVFSQMALVGERTGTLDKSLMNLVDFYQEEVNRTVDNLVSILEPALIVFLGVVVGGLMAAILMPIYRMVGM